MKDRVLRNQGQNRMEEAQRKLVRRATVLILLLTVTQLAPGGVGASERRGGDSSAVSDAESSPARIEGRDEVAQPTVAAGSRTLRLFPGDDLYRPYVADPHRVGFGVMRMSFSEVGIADSGSNRFGLRLGGRFGVLRSHPQGRPDRGWQLGIEAGFYGQFDNDHSQDNIGWDGIYGLVLTAVAGKNVSWKLGVLHTSSHVGDEIAERSGRRRINYTRQELVGGISWDVHGRWRVYCEGGWGYDLRNETLQEPARGQLGIEYEAAASLWGGRLGWYAALDASATEERDWRVDPSLQVGFVVRSAGRHWRFGVEHYDGRVPMGEFFQDDESYTALGVWLDL